MKVIQKKTKPEYQRQAIWCFHSLSVKQLKIKMRCTTLTSCLQFLVEFQMKQAYKVKILGFLICKGVLYTSINWN